MLWNLIDSYISLRPFLLGCFAGIMFFGGVLCASWVGQFQRLGAQNHIITLVLFTLYGGHTALIP